MGPVGSKVIEYRGQRSNLCISAVLGPICMKLGECLQVDPRLRFMGPVGSKVIEYRGQRSNLCFFLFVPLLLPGPWADLKFYVFFFCLFPYFSQVLGPIFTKLSGKVERALDVSSRGSFFKGQGHRGQR